MTMRTADDGVICWCYDFAYSCIPPSERNPSYAVACVHLRSSVMPLENDYWPQWYTQILFSFLARNVIQNYNTGYIFKQ